MSYSSQFSRALALLLSESYHSKLPQAKELFQSSRQGQFIEPVLLYHYTYSFLQKPPVKQAAVIPGYAGHVPRIKVNNQFLGKRQTEQARDVLKQEILDKSANGFSTTG